jgi:ribosomal protein L7/L12
MSTAEDTGVAALQERVRVLAAGLGLDADFEVPAEVRTLAKAGKTVQAIKTLRQRTSGRLSLVAAKRMVDAIAGG